MTNVFDRLIDSYIADQVGLTDNFLDDALALHLKENLLALDAAQQMTPAGVGNKHLLVQDKSRRSDKIHWLDPASNNVHEQAFFALLDHFVRYLNTTCYTGITGYEFHYALYEKGSFYHRHLDQFKSDKSRAFSMIVYLNTNWQEQDGGELCIFHADHTQLIAPENGKCVFFKSSELEHAVLVTQQPRLSITGWLKTG